MKQTNVRQFFQQFPTDEACLEHLFNVRFGQGHTCPKCERDAKWYRLHSEQAYSCQWCGHHIHPMVGSIFEKSRTPLQLWFYAIFLFTTSKHGVSGKELERQLGVTYKTAWRMAKLIREHMAYVDGEAPLGGAGEVVEVDETFVGGKTTGMDWRKRKTVVMGMMERGGDVMLKVVEDQTRGSLMPHINDNVAHGTEIHTDELKAYKKAVNVKHYSHKTVNHSKDEYVGPDGETTNSIENFFGHLKRSLKGTHNNVSPKYLEAYVKEFEYRFNRRTTPDVMLGELLSRFPELDA
ncbi:IS1595 family transposase (plasmid) [Sulfitobacter sp. W027]|uniref:IS1595 family transposase n=1 Tax=Sulfitobacter sp. W027 TaxID=2867025 RepID=UPI0021A94DF0|nr:IS1595 family transposase [Sulfitobacter sp. W027]UWR35799.1 IS1595 family transposase [Sulfitobacter sp. W027]